MKWFIRLLRKDTDEKAKSTKKRRFKLFGSKATVEDIKEEIQLKNEIDVVPRTEITASRQALDNITLASNNIYGESSGESTWKRHDKGDNKTGCGNKYCCGIECQSHVKTADKANESITDSKINKRVQIKGNKLEIPSFVTTNDNELIVENAVEAENLFYRPALACLTRDHPDFDELKPIYQHVEIKPFPTDRELIEDDFYDRTIFTPLTLNHPMFDESKPMYQYVDLKSRDYKLLSSIERNCINPRYNLRNCKKFNEDFHDKNDIFPENKGKIQWNFQDFDDDKKSTRMHDDTAAIKDYFKLSVCGDILIHMDIEIHEPYKARFCDDVLFGKWQWRFFKGTEVFPPYEELVDEEQKIEEEETDENQEPNENQENVKKPEEKETDENQIVAEKVEEQTENVEVQNNQEIQAKKKRKFRKCLSFLKKLLRKILKIQEISENPEQLVEQQTEEKKEQNDDNVDGQTEGDDKKDDQPNQEDNTKQSKFFMNKALPVHFIVECSKIPVG